MSRDRRGLGRFDSVDSSALGYIFEEGKWTYEGVLVKSLSRSSIVDPPSTHVRSAQLGLFGAYGSSFPRLALRVFPDMT